MAIEVPQNEEISGGEKNGGKRVVGFAALPSVGDMRIEEGIHIKK